MQRSQREDRKLTEVKAALQRLQKLSAEPDAVDFHSTTMSSPPRSRQIATIAALAAVVLVGVVVAVLVFVDFGRWSTPGRMQSSPTTALPKAMPEVERAAVSDHQLKTTIRPALEQALGLLSDGHVQAARRQLEALSPEDAADVAWALARSFDPNFLRTISAADARPNVEEAARWYRVWYAAAVKQGLVADSVSLERIIGSMR